MYNKNYSLGLGLTYTIDKASVDAVKAELNEINRLALGKHGNETIVKAAKEANNIIDALDKAWNSKLGQLDLGKLRNELGSLDKYQNIFTKIDSQQGQTAFRSFAKEVLNTNIQLKQSNKLLDSLATSMGNTIKWGVTSSIFNTMTGAIQKSWDYSIKLDNALNDIRIVTSKSADEMERFAKVANNSAKALGASTQDYAEAALIYYQQGYDDEEAQTRANITLKAANVTGQSGQAVSEQLTAVWNGYKVTAEEAELYIDKLAAVAAATASDLEELSVGMGKVASAANLMGVDIDQLNAQLATIVSVTRQAPESVGVALKTIYARMGDIEAGIDTETSLGSYTEKMKAMGINVLDMNGKLRDMGAVIEEIGNKWNSYSREQQVALSQIMAGTRQYNNLLSLFDNWDQYNRALEVSGDAMGTLNYQQNIYMDRVSAHLQKLKTELENTYKTIFDNKTANFFIDKLTDLVTLLNTTFKSFGGGLGTIGGITTSMLTIFGSQLGKGLETSIENAEAKISNKNAEKLKQDIINRYTRKGTPLQSDAALKSEIKNTQELLKIQDQISEAKEKDFINRQSELALLIDEIDAMENFSKIAYNISTESFISEKLKLKGTDEDFVVQQWFTDAIEEIKKERQKLGSIKTDTFSSLLREELPSTDLTKKELKKSPYGVNKNGKIINKQLNLFGEDPIIRENEEYLKKQQDILKSYEKNIKNKFDKLERNSNLTDEQKEEMDEIKQDLSTIKTLYEKIDSYELISEKDVNVLQKANEQYKTTLDALQKQAERGYKGADNYFNGLLENYKAEQIARENALKTMYDQEIRAKQIGQAIQGISVVGTSLISIFGVINNLSDETLSTTEKIKSVVSSVVIVGMQILTNLEALVKLPQNLKTAGSAIKTIVSSLNPMTLKITAIIAACVILYSIVKSIKTEQEKHEEQIKRLENAYVSLGEKARSAQSAVDEVTSSLNEYKDFLHVVYQCTKGTQEWEDAIKNVNRSALELLEQYPKLMSYEDVLERTVDGMLVLNTDKVQEYIDELKSFEEMLTVSKILLGGVKEQKEDDWDVSRLVQKINNNFVNGIRIARDKKPFDPNNHQKPPIDQNPEDGYTPPFGGFPQIGGSGGLQYVTNDDIIPPIVSSDNIFDLAGLSQEEYNKKLQSLANELVHTQTITQEEANNWVQSMQDNKDTIDVLAEEIEQTSIKIRNAGNLIAEEVVGQDGSLAEKSIVANQYTKGYQEKYDEIYGELTGAGISKASRAGNAIYKDYAKLLEEVTGGKYTALEKGNAVQGNDDNRSFVFLDENNARVKLDAEEVAAIIAAYEAEKNSETGASGDAQRLINQLSAILGLDSKVSDALLGSNFDVNSLTQEQYDAIAKNLDSNGRFKTAFINDEDAAKLGNYESASEYLRELELKLTEWDPKKAADKVKNNWEHSIKTGAEAVDVTKDAFGAYTEQLIDNNDLLEKNDDITVEVAKAHFTLAKNLNSAYEAFEDNQDILRRWADDAELTNDEIVKVGDFAKAIRDVFQINVSDNFIKDNLEMIFQLIQGDITVLDELRKAAAQDFVLGEFHVDKLENLPTEVQDLVNFINNTDLATIKIGTSLDQTSIFKVLQSLLDNFTITADQANAILKTIGFEPEVTTQWVPYEDSKEYESSYEYIDPVTQERKTVSAKSVNVANGKIQIPVINGKDIKFKGANKDVFNFTPTKKSSGSKAKPKKEDLFEDEKDIYHDVNIELQQISNELDKLSDATEKLAGGEWIENLTLQFMQLNDRIDTTKDKIKIAEGELDDLRKKLEANGVTFNSDGTMANYFDAYDRQLANLNGIITKYNGMTAKQQEAYQDTLDKAKDDFKKFVENMERYDEVLTEMIPELEMDIQEALDEQAEHKIDAFHYEVDLRLDIADAVRDWNDFEAKILDGIKEEDILGNALTTLKDFETYYNDAATGTIQRLTEHLTDIMDQIKQYEESGDMSIYNDFNTTSIEDLRNYIDEMMEEMESLYDLTEEIKDSYLNMMDEAQEKFEEQLSTYEQISSLIEHDMDLITIVYGEDAYGPLKEFYEKQHENNMQQLDFQKQQMDFWKQQMEQLEEGSDNWLDAKDKWIDAVNGWNDAITDSIEDLKDKYLNAIEDIFDRLNDKVTDGAGLDYVEQEWDLINQNAEEYLDTIDAMYAVQDLQNKYQQAIDDTDNIGAQKKLNDLMNDELDTLREKDKLTEYDVERAELRYQIALKQIQLEEAQQNKTQLRLRRDSQGNYRYQFTADNEEISSIQEEISKLYQELYNLDAGEYRENLNQLYDVWADFQEAMKEAAQINDPEERAERELLIREQYGQLINSIVEQNELAQSNMYESTMSTLFDLYNSNTENYEMMTEEQKAILDEFLNTEADMTNSAFNNLFDLYDESIDAFKNMSEAQKDILIGSVVPEWDSALQSMMDKFAGEDGFETVCKDALDELGEATQEYEDELKEIETVGDTSFDSVKDGIDETIDATKDLVTNNDELIDSYNNQLDAIGDVIEELDDLIKKYEDSAEAAKKAVKEAEALWEATNKKDADEAQNSADLEENAENIQAQQPSTAETIPSTPAPTDPSSDGILKLGDIVTFASGRYHADSYGGGASGTIGQGGKVKVSAINNNPYGYHIMTLKGGALGWVKKSQLTGYDTGGYTGDWNSKQGKLAMLHEKELVLNAQDTKNMLNAVAILRDITSNLGASLLNQMAGITANGTNAIANAIAQNGLEQMVHIDAQFPNVTNSHEIEDAINNLVNMASQHISKN